MPALVLDRLPVAVEGGPEILGDLLTAIDEDLARRARIVTAVRLDGAEEPAFRDPQVIGLKLSTLGSIEIESGTPAELAMSCLTEAGQALQALAASAEDVAARLRAGGVREGNQSLASITEGIATALTITSAASLGLGIDLGVRETPHGTLAGIAQKATRGLDAIVTAQVNEDWIAVADRLESDLVPDLRTWGAICCALPIDNGGKEEWHGCA
jgi:hypothetical protein